MLFMCRNSMLERVISLTPPNICAKEASYVTYTSCNAACLTASRKLHRIDKIDV